MRILFRLPIVILTLAAWIGWTAGANAQTVGPECGVANTVQLLERELAVDLRIPLTQGVTALGSAGAESNVAMPLLGDCTTVDGLIKAGVTPNPAVSDADIYLLTGVPTTPFLLTLHRHPAAVFRFLVADGMTGDFISNCSSFLDECLVQTNSRSVAISISAITRGVYTLSIFNGMDLSPQPDLASLSCVEQFGGAPGFLLCEQAATVCSFNTSLAPGETALTCQQRCGMEGLEPTCLGAYEAMTNSCAPVNVEMENCMTPGVSKICLCKRS